MRVYGSSPLYNYVELVFRAKRLFISAFIIALILSVAAVAFRSGTYTSKAIVLLAGSTPNVVSGNNDDPLRGSIQFKLNILNLCLKDPEFMKKAFKDAGLDRGKSEEEFTKFTKEATAALIPSANQNLLELDIRWKTAESADIISAFYNAFSQRVVSEETVVSTEKEKIIRKQLDEYTQKQKEQEQAIVKRLTKGAQQQLFGDYQTMLATKHDAENRVKSLENALTTLQRIKADVAQDLQRTPQTIEGATTLNAPEDFNIQLLQARLTQLNVQLQDLRQKLTDASPKVRDTLAQIDGIQKELELRKMVQGKKPKVSTGSKIEKNPNWLALDRKRSDVDFEIEQAKGSLADAQREEAQAQQAAMVSPIDQFNFRWATINKDLYTNIRSNLSARLEQATMDEKSDKELKTAELKMEVAPIPELEVAGGAKSLIFIAVGPIIGLIVAFAFSLLTESLDHSLRTPLEVEKFLGKPVLAVLPRLDTGKDANSSTRRLETATEGGGFISS